MTQDEEIARLRAQVAELEALLENVRGAFHKMAVDRNMWRARAKRATK